MMVRQCMFPSVSPHALSPPVWDSSGPDGLELSACDPTMASERHPFGLVRRVPSSAAQQVSARLAGSVVLVNMSGPFHLSQTCGEQN